MKKPILQSLLILTIVGITAVLLALALFPSSADDSMYEDESSEAFEGEVWSDSLDTYLEMHPE